MERLKQIIKELKERAQHTLNDDDLDRIEHQIRKMKAAKGWSTVFLEQALDSPDEMTTVANAISSCHGSSGKF
jgi:hypothetical protein